MWVIGSYEGKQAKSVTDHGDSGIGYIILERGGNKTIPTCIAAFEYSGDMPLPHHLEKVQDPFKIAEYTKRKRARMGQR
jgi:hypothetical protein